MIISNNERNAVVLWESSLFQRDKNNDITARPCDGALCVHIPRPTAHTASLHLPEVTGLHFTLVQPEARS